MEKIEAHYRVGKVLLTRTINKDGLKEAMQQASRQAWRTVKEVKIESMEDNIFIFKFGFEEKKKTVFMGGGAWHLIQLC